MWPVDASESIWNSPSGTQAMPTLIERTVASAGVSRHHPRWVKTGHPDGRQGRVMTVGAEVTDV